MADYKLLEPSSLKDFGVTAPTFGGTDTSFFATSSFVYTLFFVAIVGAAFYEYILVGVYRMEASESGIRKSNETFKRTTLGLLGVFSLFLIIFTINKGLLTGDVGLERLRTTGGGGSGVVTNTNTSTGVDTTGSGGTSRSCESTASVLAKLDSPGGICGGATCTVLSGCPYQQYLPIIDAETGGDTQLKKMIIVTMCRESRAVANPNSRMNTSDGSYDCGLMQINQRTPCSATDVDPTTNIRAGVSLMKKKIAGSSQLYPNIPAETGPFSAYNCCANGPAPNTQSVDCTAVNGFLNAVPRWACPINPGNGDFNMCSVKSYVCELSACMKQL